MKRCIALMLILATVPTIGSSNSDAITAVPDYIVEITDPGKNRTQGVVVSDAGHILTWRRKSSGDSFTVIYSTQHESQARKVSRDTSSGLTLLQIEPSAKSGVAGVFAANNLSVGQVVNAILTSTGSKTPNVATGAIGKLQPKTGIAIHNTAVEGNQFGIPLLNLCSQIVAMTIPERGIVERLFGIGSRKRGTGLAIDTVTILRFLQSQDVPFNKADTSCLPVAETVRMERESAEAARREAEDARLAREADQRALDETQNKLIELEREREAQDTANKARLEEIAEESNALQEQISNQQEKLTQQQNLSAEANAREAIANETAAQDRLLFKQQLTAAAAVFSIIVGVILWLRRRSVRRLNQEKNQVEQEALAISGELNRERADRGWLENIPDLMIEGVVDNIGTRLAIRIPGTSIGSAGGALVGRNPNNAEFIINEPTVSRRHFCVSANQEGNLKIENVSDGNLLMLGSTVCEPGIAFTLTDNSTLTIGQLHLDVFVLSSEK